MASSRNNPGVPKGLSLTAKILVSVPLSCAAAFLITTGMNAIVPLPDDQFGVASFIIAAFLSFIVTDALRKGHKP